MTKLTIAQAKAKEQTLRYFSVLFTTAFHYNEEEWEKAAEYLLQGLDTSANPCENFMKYACGKWLNGEGKTIGNELLSYTKSVDDRIQEAIDSIQVNKKSTAKYAISVSNFYKACTESTNESDMVEIAIEVFKTMTNLIGTPALLATMNNSSKDNTKNNIWRTLGIIQSNVHIATVFFDAKPVIEETECFGKILTLQFEPKYEWDDPLNAEDLSDQMELIAALLNAKINQTDMLKKIENVQHFEKKLFQLHNTSSFNVEAQSDVDNPVIIDEKMFTISTLNATLPNISWAHYFDGLFSLSQKANLKNDKYMFIVKDVTYFNDLNDLLINSDVETVFNYISYRTMRSLYNAFLQDDTDDGCLHVVKEIFAPALARILFDYYEYDPIMWSSDIQLIAETTFSALKFLISASDWVDAEDKLSLIGKINYIKFHSGIPTWLNNETEVNSRTIPMIDSESTVNAFFRLMHQNYEKNLDYIIGVHDYNEDGDPNFKVNAGYLAMNIYMYLGYALPPWYNPSYPLAVKYALMGFTLGHELMHAFDSNNVLEAPPKFANRWLKSETLKSFKIKTQCAIKQYSSYCYKQEGVCVKGSKTISENMADIDGLKLAYMAYKFALQTIGEEPPLHGLTEFTGDQIFFLAFARTRCTNNENVSLQIMTDVHAPDSARLDISLKNFPHFAKTFKCPVGSVYSPMKTCSIWGNFYADKK